MTEDDIFLNAVEIIDAAERARYIDETCAGDDERKTKVLSLLRAHDEASQFLATPAMADLRAQVQELRENPHGSSEDVDSSAATEEPAIDAAIVHSADHRRLEVSAEDKATAEDEFCRHLSPGTRPNWLGRLAHYEIEEILGHGAFGVVAKAFDEKLHRVVAIKMLRPELASTSPPRKRFLREARTAAAVTHENIVGIYAVEEDPVPYLVMEFVPGQTLQARLNQKGPLEISEILHIALQVARGLAAAHKANLIHRDIKPANILLTCDPVDRAKISDFGLARAVDDASLTSSGVIAGTPLYMAPEQARGETLDGRADLFSLGSMMYQMACGRPPFRASTTMAVLKRVCDDTPRPIKDLIPEAPEWLCAIINRLLEKNQDGRYQTADEVAEHLERCQREFQTNGVVHFPVLRDSDHKAAPTKNVARSRKRGPRWLVSALLSVAVVPIAYMIMINLAGRSGNTNVPENLTTSQGLPTQPLEDNPQSGWHGWPVNAPPPANAPFNAEQARQHQEAWAKYLNVDVEYTNSIGMKFMLIPPGEFTMGSTPEQIEEALEFVRGVEHWENCVRSEAPQHKVILTQPVYLGVTEVTQAEYEKMMGINPSHFAPSGEGKEAVAGLDTDSHAVEAVSWNDAAEFCAKLSKREELKPYYFRAGETITPLAGIGYRLPTEAEWECACRAGTTTKFWIGDQYKDLVPAGWFDTNSGRRTHPTGELKANPYGLFDIHANVWEWVEDRWVPNYYETYQGKPAIDPGGPSLSGAQRVTRGGSWHQGPSGSRAAIRVATNPTVRSSSIGFRVAIPVKGFVEGEQATQSVLNRDMGSPDRQGYMLKFDGFDDIVDIPTLTTDESHPITIEAYVASLSDEYRPVFGGHIGKPIALAIHTGKWVHGAQFNDQNWRSIVNDNSVVRIADFQHVALVKEDDELRFYLDGNLVHTLTEKASFHNYRGTIRNGLSLGAFFTDTGMHSQNQLFWGCIDEIRISNVARYKNGFTPTKRLQTDEHTMALFHVDQKDSDVLADSSGNDHHGAIHGAIKVEYSTDVQAFLNERLESDQEILSLVESVGGGIRQYRPEGTVRLLAADNPSLADGRINISIWDQPQFDDASLIRLANLLKQRPDLFVVCFHVPGTSITNTGLRSLKGLKIAQLFCDRTNVNGDEIAKEITEFEIGEWQLVPGLTEAGWDKFLESPCLKCVTTPASHVTHSFMEQFAKSNVHRLWIIGDKASDLPSVELFSDAVGLYELSLDWEEDVPESYLSDLQEHAPWLSIQTKSKVIPPDISALRSLLAQGRILDARTNAPVAEVVPASYRLQFNAQRIGDNESIAVRFPIADSAGAVVFSGWPQNNSLSGLALVDGVDIPDSKDKVEGDLFADGEAHNIVLTVTPRTVTAAVDGKEIIHWEGDPSLLRPYDHMKGVDAPLFIRPYTDFFVSDLKFEAINIVEVSEPEK
jgi:eukaryotic-like serine/threonine-protein kinase